MISSGTTLSELVKDIDRFENLDGDFGSPQAHIRCPIFNLFKIHIGKIGGNTIFYKWFLISSCRKLSSC